MAADVVPSAPRGNKVMAYFQDVMAELRKVTWPDRAQLQTTTIQIIIFVLFLGAVIALLDVVMQSVFVRGIPSLFTGR